MSTVTIMYMYYGDKYFAIDNVLQIKQDSLIS